MHISELFEQFDLQSDCDIDVRMVLSDYCTDYLTKSGGLPLFKMLPSTYSSFHRVKIRQKRMYDTISKIFDEALDQKLLRQKCLCCSGAIQNKAAQIEEPFYVFPINGFEFAYSTNVKNSAQEYSSVLEVLTNHVDSADDIAIDLIRSTYARTDLNKGIKSGSEILIYNIPFYFAAKVSSFPNYSYFLKG